MGAASINIWTLLLAAVTLATTVMGHQRYPGYDFGPGVHRLRAKRHQQTKGPRVLMNLASADGELPLRHEIRDLENNRDQWTLYLLGLSMMQYTNQSDPLSWYQITGNRLALLLPVSPARSSNEKQESMASPSRPGAV
jgi:tyrosinase